MSETLNKEILSNELAEEFDMTKVKSREIVDSIFDKFTERLANNEDVTIFGFGKFETRHRAERKGFNPSTKKSMMIKASTAAAFKPAKALKKAVDK